MKQLWTLGGAPPMIVAAARGGVEVGLLAVIGYFVQFSREIDWHGYIQFAPLVFGALRQSEGVIDSIVDPSQNRSGMSAGALQKYVGGFAQVAPAVVSHFRAIIEVGVMAAIGVAIKETTELDWREYAVFTPAVLWGLRFVEGFADQVIDPTQNRGSLAPVN